MGEGPCQDDDIGRGEVEPLRPGGRHDVRGVPGEQHPAVAHRLGDVAAHRQHGLRGDGPAVQGPVAVDGGAGVQLVPDALVGPVGGIGAVGDLEVEPADGGGTHAEQGEPALGVGVDQLVAGRGRVGEDAEPGVGVGPFEDRAGAVGDGVLGDPVETVAAGHPVAAQGLFPALVGVADHRTVGAGPFDGVHRGVEQQRSAVLEPEGYQVLDHLGLGVHRHRPAAGQRGEVDAVRAAVEAQLDAGVDDALAVQALPGPARAQGVDGALFEDAGALAALDVGPVAALQHDAVDARVVQHAGEQQPRRAAADDADGGVHGSHPSLAPSSRRTCSATAKAALAAGTPQ